MTMAEAYLLCMAPPQFLSDKFVQCGRSACHSLSFHTSFRCRSNNNISTTKDVQPVDATGVRLSLAGPSSPPHALSLRSRLNKDNFYPSFRHVRVTTSQAATNGPRQNGCQTKKISRQRDLAALVPLSCKFATGEYGIDANMRLGK
jgi:hypothetical protein